MRLERTATEGNSPVDENLLLLYSILEYHELSGISWEHGRTTLPRLNTSRNR